jgi:predicted dehydrogenase
MMTKKLKVAIIGGGIGEWHIRGFKSLPDQFEVVSICDIDETRARQIAAEFDIPHVHTNLSDVCQLANVDVIDICTPPYLHGMQVKEVLAADKHVICEKPLVSSLKEVDELIVAEANSGKRVMPIFQYRFGHGLQKLKLLVEQGIAGQAYLTTVETAWYRGEDYFAVPWHGKWTMELGGGPVTYGIHAHDMMCYILGPVKSVFARTATRVNPTETDDCDAVSIEMADGSLATLAVTLGSHKQITRHRFCFSNLTTESNTLPYSNSSDPWNFEAATPELAKQIDDALSNFQPQPEGFTGQFWRFYYALQEGAELPVTLVDARASIELITAIYYSSQTKQNVELPIVPDHPHYSGWLPEQIDDL